MAFHVAFPPLAPSANLCRGPCIRWVLRLSDGRLCDASGSPLTHCLPPLDTAPFDGRGASGTVKAGNAGGGGAVVFAADGVDTTDDADASEHRRAREGLAGGGGTPPRTRMREPVVERACLPGQLCRAKVEVRVLITQPHALLSFRVEQGSGPPTSPTWFDAPRDLPLPAALRPCVHLFYKGDAVRLCMHRSQRVLTRAPAKPLPAAAAARITAQPAHRRAFADGPQQQEQQLQHSPRTSPLAPPRPGGSRPTTPVPSSPRSLTLSRSSSPRPSSPRLPERLPTSAAAVRTLPAAEGGRRAWGGEGESGATRAPPIAIEQELHPPPVGAAKLGRGAVGAAEGGQLGDATPIVDLMMDVPTTELPPLTAELRAALAAPLPSPPEPESGQELSESDLAPSSAPPSCASDSAATIYSSASRAAPAAARCTPRTASTARAPSPRLTSRHMESPLRGRPAGRVSQRSRGPTCPAPESTPVGAEIEQATLPSATSSALRPPRVRSPSPRRKPTDGQPRHLYEREFGLSAALAHAAVYEVLSVMTVEQMEEARRATSAHSEGR